MSHKTRFVLILIFLTFLPYLILGIIGFRYGRSALRNFVLERVESVNNLRASHVEKFFADLTNDVSLVAKSPALIDVFPKLNQEAGNPSSSGYAALDAFVDSLVPAASSTEYLDVHLVKQDGTILYSSDSSDTQEVGEKASGLMAESIRDGQSGLYFSPVFETGELEHPFAMYVAYPVRDADGGTLGLYQAEVSLNSVFDDVTQTLGLSSSGESYLGFNDGFSIRYLTPLQNDPNAPLTRVAAKTDTSHPLVLATSGKKGSGSAVDYDNVKVLAAWRPLKTVDWGIVTKVNENEALNIITDIRDKLNIVILVAAIVLSLVIIYVVHRTIDKPLAELSAMAEKLARNEDPGKLGAKLLYSNDAIGKLANSLHHISRHRKRGDSHEAEAEDLLEHKH